MRILLVCDTYPPDRIGGIGYIVQSLRQELLKQNHEVIVLTTGNKNIAQKEEGIVKTSTSMFLGSLLHNLLIIKWVVQQKFDVINLHHTLSTLFLLFFPFLKLLKVPLPKVINSLQVDYIQEFKMVRSITINKNTYQPVFKEKVEKFLNYPLHILVDLIGYYLADIVSAPSIQNKKEIEKNYGFIKKKEVIIIPNGINTEHFTYSKNTFGTTPIQLIYVGVFRVRKRLYNAIELIRCLKEEYHLEVNLTIIGRGRKGYNKKINQLIKDHQLEDNIELVGEVKNEAIPSFLEKSHIFLLLSSYEGMSVALLEALGTGKVVISTNLYGSKDIIEDGVTGVLVELDNIKETAKKIALLYNTPNLIQQISTNAQQMIRKKYAWHRIVDYYLAQYK